MSVLCRPYGDEMATHYESILGLGYFSQYTQLKVDYEYDILCSDGLHYVGVLKSIENLEDINALDSSITPRRKKYNDLVFVHIKFYNWAKRYEYKGPFDSLYIAQKGTYSSPSGINPLTNCYSHQSADNLSYFNKGFRVQLSKCKPKIPDKVIANQVYESGALWRPYNKSRKHNENVIEIEKMSNKIAEEQVTSEHKHFERLNTKTAKKTQTDLLIGKMQKCKLCKNESQIYSLSSNICIKCYKNRILDNRCPQITQMVTSTIDSTISDNNNNNNNNNNQKTSKSKKIKNHKKEKDSYYLDRNMSRRNTIATQVYDSDDLWRPYNKNKDAILEQEVKENEESLSTESENEIKLNDNHNDVNIKVRQSDDIWQPDNKNDECNYAMEEVEAFSSESDSDTSLHGMQTSVKIKSSIASKVYKSDELWRPYKKNKYKEEDEERDNEKVKVSILRKSNKLPHFKPIMNHSCQFSSIDNNSSNEEKNSIASEHYIALNRDKNHSRFWSKNEENILLKARNTYGNKWKVISTLLPGRTENQIKNHWYSVMRAKFNVDNNNSNNNSIEQPISHHKEKGERRILINLTSPNESEPVLLIRKSHKNIIDEVSLNKFEKKTNMDNNETISPTINNNNNSNKNNNISNNNSYNNNSSNELILSKETLCDKCHEEIGTEQFLSYFYSKQKSFDTVYCINCHKGYSIQLTNEQFISIEEKEKHNQQIMNLSQFTCLPKDDYYFTKSIDLLNLLQNIRLKSLLGKNIFSCEQYDFLRYLSILHTPEYIIKEIENRPMQVEELYILWTNKKLTLYMYENIFIFYNKKKELLRSGSRRSYLGSLLGDVIRMVEHVDSFFHSYKIPLDRSLMRQDNNFLEATGIYGMTSTQLVDHIRKHNDNYKLSESILSFIESNDIDAISILTLDSSKENPFFLFFPLHIQSEWTSLVRLVTNLASNSLPPLIWTILNTYENKLEYLNKWQSFDYSSKESIFRQYVMHKLRNFVLSYMHLFGSKCKYRPQTNKRKKSGNSNVCGQTNSNIIFKSELLSVACLFICPLTNQLSVEPVLISEVVHSEYKSYMIDYQTFLFWSNLISIGRENIIWSPITFNNISITSLTIINRL